MNMVHDSFGGKLSLVMIVFASHPADSGDVRYFRLYFLKMYLTHRCLVRLACP